MSLSNDPYPVSGFNRSILRIILHSLRNKWYLLLLGVFIGGVFGIYFSSLKKKYFEARASFIAPSALNGLVQSEILGSRDLFLEAAQRTREMQIEFQNGSGNKTPLKELPFLLKEFSFNPPHLNRKIEIEFGEGESYELTIESGNQSIVYRSYLGIPLDYAEGRLVLGQKPSMKTPKGKWTIRFFSPKSIFNQFGKNLKVEHYRSSQNKIGVSYLDESEDRALDFLSSFVGVFREFMIGRQRDSLKQSMVDIDEKIKARLSQQNKPSYQPGEDKKYINRKLYNEQEQFAQYLIELDRRERKRNLLVGLLRSEGFDKSFMGAYSSLQSSPEDTLLLNTIMERDAQSELLNKEGRSKHPELYGRLRLMKEDILVIARKIFNDEAFLQQAVLEEIRQLEDISFKLRKEQNRLKASLGPDIYQRVRLDSELEEYTELLRIRMELKSGLGRLNSEFQLLERPFIKKSPRYGWSPFFMTASMLLAFGLSILLIAANAVFRSKIVLKEELLIHSHLGIWAEIPEKDINGRGAKKAANALRIGVGQIPEGQARCVVLTSFAESPLNREFVHQFLMGWSKIGKRAKVYEVGKTSGLGPFEGIEMIEPLNKDQSPDDWALLTSPEKIWEVQDTDLIVFVFPDLKKWPGAYYLMSRSSLNIIQIGSGDITKEELLDLEKDIKNYNINIIGYLFVE